MDSDSNKLSCVLDMAHLRGLKSTNAQQRLYAIRVSVVIQAFCPAQTSVHFDRKVARNPLLHIASAVSSHCKTPHDY